MRNAILLTILLAAVPCSAAVITVEPDGSGNEPTIQAAVDTAVIGDEVVLAIGTYTGYGNRDIDFGGKSITVRSTNPNDPNTVAATIINCQGTESKPRRGFSFISGEGANSIVDGLTITNGYGPVEIIEFNGQEYQVQVGGAIYCRSSSPTIANCTFTGNSAGHYGGGMSNWQNSSPTVTNCTFGGNSARFGGGMCNCLNSNPIVTNCTFTGNSTGWSGSGGGMYNLDYSSPIVDSCTFTANSADIDGGGMANNWDSSPTVSNCIFTGNSALAACVCITGGGGIYNDGGSPIITNCTFIGNSASFGGGILSGSATITNCILWANGSVQVYGWGPMITYSNIQGGWEGDGHSNFDIDPNFVDDGYWDDNGTPGDPDDDFWVDGDYHLSLDSLCIDTGDPCFLADPDATDLDGNPRIADGDYDGIAVVDMGAFEVQPDPIVLLDILADYIIDLGLEGIGNGRGLLAKLETAIKKLSDETVKNDAAAVNSLKAFINSVEAQSGRKIDEDEADILIAAVQQILDMLSNE